MSNDIKNEKTSNASLNLEYYVNEFFALIYEPFVKGKGYTRFPSEISMVEATERLLTHETDPKKINLFDEETSKRLCEEALKKCFRRITPWQKITNHECYIDYLAFKPIKTSLNLYPYVHTETYVKYNGSLPVF